VVRERCAHALGKVGAAEGVPALTASLRDPEWTVRRHAALALGELGAAARPAASALEQLGRDTDRRVRQAAQEALKKIRS
jgi:HEAT repeat protein